VSQRPTQEAPVSGARWLLERAAGDGDAAKYIGSIRLPDASYELSLSVEPDGAVRVEATNAPEALVRHAVQFVRAATKGGARPRRVARWRASTA
jgi:hypothetical protein